MFKFIRENSGIIVKFILTHVVMSVLGIMVGLAVIVIGGESQGVDIISIIAGVFTVGFMCFMHYDDMYFFAVKEGIRVRSEGAELDRWKGVKIVLIAYSPVILIGVVTSIIDIAAGGILNVSPIALLVYYAVQGSFLPFYVIREYLGVTGYVLITLLPAVISGILGYTIGFKDKTLRGLFGMKVKPPYDGPLERKPKKENNKNEK